MFPIGGFVAMAGENGEEGLDDPNSFDKKPAWQRFIITVAGAFVNIVFGFLAMLVLCSFINIGGTTVGEFDKTQDGISSSEFLMVGDTITEIDGKRVYISDELSYEIMRRGHVPVDVLVIRGGKEILLEDVTFPTAETQGQLVGVQDFYVFAEEKTPALVISHAFRKSVLIVRTCFESIYDLITGRFTLAAVSGPVGISSAIGDAANDAGIIGVVYITVLISINLGFMNLLPIPALDGGRTVTLLFEMITKKRVPPKIEGAVNGIFLILLLILTFVVMAKDIISLI
jgi:regulator of sigma E protease